MLDDWPDPDVDADDRSHCITSAVADPVRVEEDADAGIRGHHVVEPRRVRGPHGSGEAHRGRFVRQVREHRLVAERNEFHRFHRNVSFPIDDA